MGKNAGERGEVAQHASLADLLVLFCKNAARFEEEFLCLGEQAVLHEERGAVKDSVGEQGICLWLIGILKGSTYIFYFQVKGIVSMGRVLEELEEIFAQ